MNEKKRKFQSVKKINNQNDDEVDKFYRFNILLPNGIKVPFVKKNPERESISLGVFVQKLRDKCSVILEQTESSKKPKRKILWDSNELYLEDGGGNKFKSEIRFDVFKPNKVHLLTLFDGADQTVETFENMWDLTPDTDLLTELPDDYTFETALADLIDNSLQAVWSNGKGERKLISVDIDEKRISLFDTGPGMDGSDEKSIVKWGKMGASVHRSSKKLAIGGKPPFLTPFFGMFGYGGTLASMHLGRQAVVSAKTKQSKKVFWLCLDREALVKRSSSNWKAPGGLRDPSDSEIEMSPHGSFTKIVMKPKLKLPDIFQLQCKLKDIYFPYIQCDEISTAGRTTTLVDFQINGISLAEIEGGEVAITHMHSCNGPDFIVDLHFYIEEDKAASTSPSVKPVREGNARLKCVYFPFTEGKESIERILEKLNADGYAINEDYDTFSRISIRRLGRLLPEARWELLPFMKPKQKRGAKVQILKRCCSRVKCFVDTDAGFNPVPSKTDLAPHHSFTKALKDLGGDTLHKEKVVQVSITRGGKQLSLQQLEREYQAWIFQMHSQYDDECNTGDDEAVLLVTADKEALGITADVVRVHQAITRKGISWSRGQKVKILKGACTGCHKNNMFAILEYFLLEGLEKEVGGEARIICRPLGVEDKDGSVLTVDASGTNLELRNSISLPIIAIDSGKCNPVDDNEWNFQADKLILKMPSTVEVLGPKQCKALDIYGALPTEATVSAGSLPPKEVVAILRPSNFNPGSTDELDQKYIVRENFEMCLDIEFKAGAGQSVKFDPISAKNTTRKEYHGLYVFPVASIPSLFQKAGTYSFSFSLKNSTTVSCEKIVRVKASAEVKRWELLKDDDRDLPLSVSAGSCFPPLSFCRYDEYDNIIPFKGIQHVEYQLMSNDTIISSKKKAKVELSSDTDCIIVTNVRVIADTLDKIRPSYDATLALSQPGYQPFFNIPCQVFPGPPATVKIFSSVPDKGLLLPQQVIADFKLEMFDKQKNHVKQGVEVELVVHGFSLLDNFGLKRTVDNAGFVDLSGLLKVTEGYGKPVSLTFKFSTFSVAKKFEVVKRELRMVTVVPEVCPVGSKLKDIAFEVVNAEGELDLTIDDEVKHGKHHTLSLRLLADLPDDHSARYPFQQGRCVVKSFTLPQTEGSFFIEAFHSVHTELRVKFEVKLSRSTPPTHTESDSSSDLRATEELDCVVPQSSDERSTSVSVSDAEYHSKTKKGFEFQKEKSTPVSVSDAAKHSKTKKGSEFQSSEVTVPLCLEEYDTLSSLQTPKAEHRNTTPALFPESKLRKQQFSFVQAPLAQTSNKKSGSNCADSYTPEHAVTLLGPDSQEIETVQQEIRHHKLCIKDHEESLIWPEARRNELMENLGDLQDELELLPQPSSLIDSKFLKESVLEIIENKVDSAAATYNIASQNMYLKDRYPDFMADVVGVVALLSTAPSPMLSRCLAEYLGEDKMMAIVCLSSDAITTPENYETVLKSLAGELGRSFEGRQLIICLEDISAFPGEVLEHDHQRRFDVRDPTLPDGTTPPGFLGYAVNMIDISVDHIHVKTVAGRGLRETLFYYLFRDLQVYETKEHMKRAFGYIPNSAISLDGGIINKKDTPTVSLGVVNVHFPVVAEEQESREKINKEIKKLKSELSMVEEAIVNTNEEKEESLRIVQEKETQLLKFIDDKEVTHEHIFSQQSLQTTPGAPAPTQSPCH
ncbi:structural maintenance of chromosomes flexible hinge domain-containing protein GMI1 isoform X2 [Spinacia oleracea]|uniref:Structural maintenance of chromosomes flexible hinge domain-containing protein GMI1 isoform X2 n=1 Tax=Spinacia oleracea TaxID=3562 RepID=A0ABM3RFM7_SPIOL|nr:structural maintenance of chromosomes flexible hinge domain-containing protein GMI1-like isoform X2 [Spinacia oleracea]